MFYIVQPNCLQSTKRTALLMLLKQVGWYRRTNISRTLHPHRITSGYRWLYMRFFTVRDHSNSSTFAQTDSPYGYYPNVTTTLRSGICRRNSVCLSSVCNVCAPLLSRLKFSPMFLCRFIPRHLLTTMQNFMEIVPGKGLNARSVAKYSDVRHVEGYLWETVQDTASVRPMSKNKSYP